MIRLILGLLALGGMVTAFDGAWKAEPTLLWPTNALVFFGSLIVLSGIVIYSGVKGMQAVQF